ncbi:MAG: hypothetical protein FJ291_34435, partial [Planctomycetes bacterium]|nr:hypothetical protein [Planctomycetota bacterium]
MLPLLLAFIVLTTASAQRLDLAPFARPCCAQDEHRLQTTFDYGHPRGVVQAPDGSWIYGLQWAEERDLLEVAVCFRRPYDAARIGVQYWHHNWPPPPPRMPTIEDPVDDPWQGAWLTARTNLAREGLRCRFTFRPLEAAENPRASNLPGLRYRRAVRFRLVFPKGERPEVETVEVFSETTLRRMELRVTAPWDRPSACRAAGETACATEPDFRAYNGHVREVRRF